jgi:hypothetical protein
VWVAVRVGDERAGFACHEYARRSVPRFVGHHDASVKCPLGDERKVERRRPDHADTFDEGYEVSGERKALLVMDGGVVADGVITE